MGLTVSCVLWWLATSLLFAFAVGRLRGGWRGRQMIVSLMECVGCHAVGLTEPGYNVFWCDKCLDKIADKMEKESFCFGRPDTEEDFMTWIEWWRIAHRVQRRLLYIKQGLDIVEIEREGNTDMVDPKVAALIAEFDVATSAIAGRIQRLIDAGGLSTESQAALQGEVDKLTALGSDPEVPVPPPTT